MLASALTAYAALRPDPAAPDPELLRAIEELDARLDRSAFVDLADFERDALEVRQRAQARSPELARLAIAHLAEAAARRYLEYGERPADRRMARAWAGLTLQDDPPHGGVWLAWAVAADTATAARSLRQALDATRPSAEVLEARAVLRRRAGDALGALGDLSAAAAAAPTRAATQRLFARALAERGALDSAVDALGSGPRSASGLIHARAAAAARELRDGGRDPADPTDLDAPGGVHPWERGRAALLGLALDPASDVARERLDSASAAYPDRADFRRAVGDAALAHRRFSMAVSLYREALELEPDHRAAEVGLARARLASKLEWCRGGTPLELGQLAVEPSRFELVRFQPSVSVFPEHLYAELRDAPPNDRARGFAVANRVALGEQCLSDDRVARAARYLEQAARRDSNLVEPALVARAMLSAGRPEAALAVASGHPTDPMMAVLRARALDELGEREAARVAVAEVATSTAALAPAALALAARWALEAGQLESARDALERLRTLAPDRLEVEILELELAASTPSSTAPAERARFADRVLRRLTALDDDARSELTARLPARAAAAIATSADDGALRRQLLEVAVRASEAPDALRLDLAEQQIRDRRTRQRGRALLRELASASEDRAVRASARRLLRR